MEAANVTKIAEAAILSSKTGAPIYLNLKDGRNGWKETS